MAGLFRFDRLLSTEETGTIAEMRVLILAMLLFACGGHPPPPKRGVVEGDVGGWKFRRFQPMSEPEVWVEGNKAQVYTASYVTDAAEKAGHVDDKDVVWRSDFGRSGLWRFAPATGRFARIPLRAGADVRQLLGRPGEVWGAESGADRLVVVRR